MLDKKGQFVELPLSEGKFITFEGGEGSGKTTQIKMFRQYLEEQGLTVVQTREPGGTGCVLAESIRAMLLNPDNKEMNFTTEFFLFMAARAQHVQDVIAPALARGWIVLCDRFADSTWAYQIWARQTVKPYNFTYCNNMAITFGGRSYTPDLTFMLDIDFAVGMTRALERNKRADDQSEARFDNEQFEFHRLVNEGFKLIASSDENKGRIYRVDASTSIEQVGAQIINGWITKIKGQW
jgi:dTMP kinase